MAERLPQGIFHRPGPSEVPVLLNRDTITQEELINVYNSAFTRLMEQRQVLEERYANGEFNGLLEVAEKEAAGQPLTPEENLLVENYRTLLDARITYHGRNNLNAARLVAEINRKEDSGVVLNDVEQRVKELYQQGNSHMIGSLDRPLERGQNEDRFVIPCKEDNQNFAIIDGAPVEGLIRFIDQEITELQGTTGYSGRLSILRHERDVLYTQSTPIFATENSCNIENSVYHARKQIEAYYNYIDPLRSEWILPDWFNGEALLKDRRVLNISEEQRGRNRWGCLPLLLPIPLLLLWGLNVNTNPCAGTGGNLKLEVFTPQEAKVMSIEGAIEREMAATAEGISQTEYVSDDDPGIRTRIDIIKDQEKEFYDARVVEAVNDYFGTAKRIRGDNNETPWIDATDFDPRKVLASCLSPEVRDQRVREQLRQKHSPRWDDGIRNFLSNIGNLIPRIQVSIK